jgi:hypothetical protein
MITCAKCGLSNEPGNAFCQDCGAALTAPVRPAPTAAPVDRQTVVAGLERRVYFNIARVVTWGLLILALLGLGYSIFQGAPVLAELSASAKPVTEQELRAAVEQSQTGRRAQPGNEDAGESVSAADLANLDKAIYELVLVLPQDTVQQYGGMDGMRNQIKANMRGADAPGLDEQIELVGNAKDIVSKMPEGDRLGAISYYFQLLEQHKSEAEMRQGKAKTQGVVFATAFVVCAIGLMILTMNLVLLAIERNTRA